MPHLSIYLDSELHKKFKAKCSLEGKSMKEVMTDLIKNYIGETNE